MVYGAGDGAQEQKEEACEKAKMNDSRIDILEEAAVQQ